MATVRTNVVPTVRNPVEGVHYTVLAGDPVDGDPVRIDGTTFRYFSVNPAPPTPPAVGTYKGTIRAKSKVLNKAGKYSESVALLKTIGE